MLQSASSCVWMLVTRRQVSTSVQRCTRNQWHNFPESIYVYICAYINVVLFHFSTANTLWLYHGRGNKLLISPFYSGRSEQRPVVMTFNHGATTTQGRSSTKSTFGTYYWTSRGEVMISSGQRAAQTSHSPNVCISHSTMPNAHTSPL